MNILTPAKCANPRGRAPQPLENARPAQMGAHSATRPTNISSLHVSLPDSKIKSSPDCGNEVKGGIISRGEKLQVLSSLSEVCYFSSRCMKMKVGTRQRRTQAYHWQPVPQRNGIPFCQRVFPTQPRTQSSPNVNGMMRELET